MRRRGFFGALAGIMAAPIAAKAAETVEKIEEAAPVVVEKKALGPRYIYSDADLMATCYVASSCTPFTRLSASDWGEGEEEHDEYDEED